MRVMLAGTKSGAGKTSITCGLINVFKKYGYKVSSLKCGPDYIDPMFHRQVLKIHSGNIDCFMSDEDYCLKQTELKEKNSDILIMEGVMGYYDGIGFTSKAGSSDIAKVTSTPVILIVDSEGSSKSVMAVVKGFIDMDSDKLIKGVIFNKMSEQIYLQASKELIKLGIVPCGFVPKDKNFILESRHLGLVTPLETADITNKLNYISQQLEKTLDIQAIINILNKSAAIEKVFSINNAKKEKIRIGVAYDEAFCFIYDDLWEAFDRNGISAVVFSPIRDKRLPDGISGIYLCGGYPENYLKELSENISMLENIKQAFDLKLPIIAECGGFMYLHENVEDEYGQSYPLVGIVNGVCRKTKRLQNFGYGTLEFNKNCIIGKIGEKFPIHSFHYYTSTSTEADCRITKASNGSTWSECCVNNWFYGGFPHFFMQGDNKMLNRFYTVCKNWQEANK